MERLGNLEPFGHIDPKPRALQYARSRAERWTWSFIERYRFLADICFRTSARFERYSRIWWCMSRLVNVLNLMAITILALMLVADDEAYAAAAAVFAVLVIGLNALNSAMDFEDGSINLSVASYNMWAMYDQIGWMLNRPFEERPDPYKLGILLSQTYIDILLQAKGQQLELNNNPFYRDDIY